MATPNSVSEIESTCFIAEGTVITGEFKTSANVRLDGAINGTVNCDGKIAMGKKGAIKGDIITQNSTIEGVFEGEIKVKDTLHLYPTANVNGKFTAEKMIVDEGAVISGECSIGPKK